MSDIDESLKVIIESQRTIDKLLDAGSLEIREFGKGNKWQLEPLHNGEDCNVGFVHIEEVEYGPCEPHIHSFAKEYLIVISGSVMLNIEGVDVRVLKTGDCGVVFEEQLHYSRPLEPGTKLLYVCVPADKGMAQLTKRMKEKP